MKILSIAKLKDAFLMMPPAVMSQIMEVSMAGMEQSRKRGNVLEYYVSPSGINIVLLEYKTAEDWAKDQLTIPVLTYMDIESYILTDGWSSVKGFTEAIKAAAKMMPGAPR